MAWDDEQKKLVSESLRQKGALKVCEACGHGNFTMADEAIQLSVAARSNHFAGRSIPSVAIICSNCGNVRFHALGVLGLLDLGNRNV